MKTLDCSLVWRSHQFPCLVYRPIGFSPCSYTRSSTYGQHWDLFCLAAEAGARGLSRRRSQPLALAVERTRVRLVEKRNMGIKPRFSRTLDLGQNSPLLPAPCSPAPCSPAPCSPASGDYPWQSLRRLGGKGYLLNHWGWLWLTIKLPVNVGRWGDNSPHAYRCKFG